MHSVLASFPLHRAENPIKIHLQMKIRTLSKPRDNTR